MIPNNPIRTLPRRANISMNKTKKSLTSRITSTLLWPARFISARMRMAIGLSLGVFSLVLLSQFFQIIPTHNDLKMGSRGLQTETLALTGTALASATRDISGFQDMLQNVVESDPEDRLRVAR